jgi:hypothetical protein
MPRFSSKSPALPMPRSVNFGIRAFTPGHPSVVKNVSSVA